MNWPDEFLWKQYQETEGRAWLVRSMILRRLKEHYDPPPPIFGYDAAAMAKVYMALGQMLVPSSWHKITDI